MEQAASDSPKNEGLQFLKAGQVDEAIEAFERALHHDQDDAQLHMYLGIAYGRKNDKLHAIHHLETSVNLDENPRALYNLGMIYETAHRIDEAVRQYKMAIQLDPAYAQAQDALGRLQSQFAAAHVQDSPPVEEAAEAPAAEEESSAPAGTQVAAPPAPAPPNGPPDWAEIQAERDRKVVEQQKLMMKAGLTYGVICGAVVVTLGYLAVSMYLLHMPRILTLLLVIIGGAVYGGLVGLWIGTTCGGDSAGMQAGAVLGAIAGLVVALIYGAGAASVFAMIMAGLVSGVVGWIIGRMVDSSIGQV